MAVTARTTSCSIQKLYMVLTLHLSVEYGSQNKQRFSFYTPLTDWFCITEMKSVYCVVWTESLYKTDMCHLRRVKYHTVRKSSLCPLIRRLSKPRGKKKIFCPCWEWNHDMSVIHPITLIYLPLTFLYCLSITVLPIYTCI